MSGFFDELKRAFLGEPEEPVPSDDGARTDEAAIRQDALDEAIESNRICHSDGTAYLVIPEAQHGADQREIEALRAKVAAARPSYQRGSLKTVLRELLLIEEGQPGYDQWPNERRVEAFAEMGVVAESFLAGEYTEGIEGAKADFADRLGRLPKLTLVPPAPAAAAPSQGTPAPAAQPAQSALRQGPQGRERSFDELYRQIIDVVHDDYRYAMAEKEQTDSLRSEAGRFANALLKGQFTSLEVARAEFKKYAEECLVELTRSESGTGRRTATSQTDSGTAAAAPLAISDDDPRIMQVYENIGSFRDLLLKVHPYSWIIEEIKSGLSAGKSLGDIVRDLKGVVEERERYVRQVISDELGQSEGIVDGETINRIATHLDAQDDTIRSMVRAAIERMPTIEAQPTHPVVSEPPSKPGFLRTAEDLVREKRSDG